MTKLPSSPVPPAELLERWLPELFAGYELPAAARDLELRVAVELLGEQGGRWRIALSAGRLSVEPGDAPAGLTLLQSVEDFRGALWHGRGGPFGRRVAGWLGADAREPAAGPPRALPVLGDEGSARALAALASVEALAGRLALFVSDGETGAAGGGAAGAGGAPGEGAGDWRLDLAFGSGEPPPEPTTRVRLSVADAEALESGALSPVEALVAGRVRITGDLALMLQVQSILQRAAPD